jgi:hypothetical protein
MGKALTVKLTAGLFILLLVLTGIASAQPADLQACLPSNIKLGDIVDGIVSWSTGGRRTVIGRTTVRQTLAELKAYCGSDNNLVDSSGREIRFYRLIDECRGAPLPREILQKQQDEINRLKERYTVVQTKMTCSGIPSP